MATRNPVKNTLYFGFNCSQLKNEVNGAHFLLLQNNQYVTVKSSANFKKILGSGFRATLICQHLKLDITLKGQCHGDLLLFQKSKNVFGLTETVK